MKASSMGATLLSNGTWSFLNQVARVASLAFITIALSRHFGPQRFGSFAFGLAFVRIFSVIAAFGLDRVIVRHLVDLPDRKSTIIRQAFRLKLTIAFASYILMLVVCAVGISDRTTLAIAALAGSGLLFQAFDVFDFAFQAEHRFRTIFFGRALPILFSAALKIAALFANASLLTFAALETVEAALVGAALFIAYRKCSCSPENDSDFSMSIKRSRILAEGFPLLLASLAVMIYMRSDIIILGKLAGYQAAGIYSAAAQISEGCALLPMAFLPALFPVLVRWRRNGPRFYHRQFEKLFLGTIVVGFCISVALTIAAPWLIPLLFGQVYAPAVTVLRILAWAPTFVFIGIMQSGYDITEGLTWLATLRTAIGALINIALNFALIPIYGPTGAAVATLISFACSAFLLNFAQAKTRPVFGLQLRALLVLPVLFRPLRYE
jgi:PST family polysaccharide transporter